MEAHRNHMPDLTNWPRAIEAHARKLAQCRTFTEIEGHLGAIETELARTPYPSGRAAFWEELIKCYRGQPRPLDRDSAAAAVLTALFGSVLRELEQRAQRG